MALSSSAIKEVLAKENIEFKKLYETHRSYDERLSLLNKRPFLSATEEMEIMELKKKKLILKDQMQVMMADYERRNVS